MRGLNVFGLLILFATLSLSVDAQTGDTKNTLIPVNDSRIEIIGRTSSGKHGEIQLAFPGAGIRLRFTGATLVLDVSSSTETAALTVVVVQMQRIPCFVGRVAIDSKLKEVFGCLAVVLVAMGY